MIIAIGSDHAGYFAKEAEKAFLAEIGIEVLDMGCFSEESVHYPVYAELVAKAINEGKAERGVLICGTGLGMSIVANRFPGIRATVCHDTFTAKASREHNDSNILVMGARVVSEELMKLITEIWLNAKFLGGRHTIRLEMIDAIDKKKR